MCSLEDCHLSEVHLNVTGIHVVAERHVPQQPPRPAHQFEPRHGVSTKIVPVTSRHGQVRCQNYDRNTQPQGPYGQVYTRLRTHEPTVMRRLTTETSSKKCVVKRFRRRVNVTECTNTKLETRH